MAKTPDTKLYDLTQEWGAGIPPWPYFPDPVVASFHRFPKDNLHSMRVDTAMHVGTHVDAPLHFNPEGWDSAEIPLDVLFGEGIVVDLSQDVSDFDIITPEMVEEKAQVREGDVLILNTGLSTIAPVGSHADEIETSLMMVVAPELVDMAQATPSPFSAKAPAPGALSPDDPTSPNYSPSGSFGDPTLASVDKGSRLLAAILEDMMEAAG